MVIVKNRNQNIQIFVIAREMPAAIAPDISLAFWRSRLGIPALTHRHRLPDEKCV